MPGFRLDSRGGHAVRLVRFRAEASSAAVPASSASSQGGDYCRAACRCRAKRELRGF